MKRFRPRVPGPALILSLIALVVALAGTSYAALSNSVGTRQLTDGAVTTKKIKTGAVTTDKIKDGAVTTTKIKNGAVTASKINTSGLTVPNASHASTADSATSANHASSADNATHATTADSVSVVSIHATMAVDASASLLSAPQIPLGSKGPFSFYGKCYVNAGGDVEATTYISSTSNTGMFDTEAGGRGYVIPSTPEANRELQDVTTSGPDSFAAGQGDKDFMATDGTTTIYGIVGLAAAKAGNPADGNGPFGPGMRCMFGEVLFG
jgi:hypothetical protein